MNEEAILEMTPVNNLRGGNGVVFVSKNFRVDDMILSIIRIPSGSSIGPHEDGEKMDYKLIHGPMPLIGGNRTQEGECRPGYWHDLVNDTAEDVVVLSKKSNAVTD